MSFNTNFPTIDLIIGPMFAGKTTELIRRLNIYAELGFKTLYINSSLDTRSNKIFSTHNPIIEKIHKIDTIKIEYLCEANMWIYDIIGIDESQLFSNLKKHVIKYTEDYGKKLIVAGS